jgi:hypothetical protein
MESFPRWEGYCDGRTMVDFLGMQSACHYRPHFSPTPKGNCRPDLPAPNQNWVEYLSVLRSVQEAYGSFNMVELGAGYEFWLVSASQALRLRGHHDCRLLKDG